MGGSSLPSGCGDNGTGTLWVEEATHNDNSIGMINSGTMASLGLDPGDVALLRGELGRETVLTCLDGPNAPDGTIQMNKVAQANLGVKRGQSVRVKILGEHDIRVGSRIRLLPFEKDAKALSVKCDILKDLVVPYFHDQFRAIHRGDIVDIRGPKGKLKLRVADIEKAQYCIVTDESRFELVLGWWNIGGHGRQVRQIRDLVTLPLRQPRIFEAIGVAPARGILMFGPPGVGKTRVARAVANEAAVPFILINGPEIMSHDVGKSEENLRSRFEEAMGVNGSAIIFIDEIDSIAPKRDKSGGGVENRLVAQLLTLMDDVRGHTNTIVIAATNRPNSIDPALRRFGRFGHEVDFGVPDEKGRLEILNIHCREMRLADDVRVEEIAAGTHGHVGADIAALCAAAAMIHIRRNRKQFERGDLASLGVTMGDFRRALKKSNPSCLRETVVEIPKVGWKDIGGLDPVAQELQETVEFPVKHPRMLQQFRMSPSRGVLLYGPPGTGKTLLAKAVASECGVNFISVKGPELLSKWFGESEANVRDIFDKARAAAPCVVFFDELDSLGRVRIAGRGDAGASDRVLNQILTEMDGVNAKKDVFIIGATNRPDHIDPALLRPGRLDRLIYIPLPDDSARYSILNAILGPSQEAASLENLRWLASKTPGFSGADLMGICQRAMKLAIREALKAQPQAISTTSVSGNDAPSCPAINAGLSEDTEEEVDDEYDDDDSESNDVDLETEYTGSPQVSASQLKREYLEEALRDVRPSVSEEDIRRHEIFSQVGPRFLTLDGLPFN